MTTDTIFRIASQIEGAHQRRDSVARWRKARSALNDPASRFIPTFAKTTVAAAGRAAPSIVPAKRPITIRDLLTHTAGISYGTDAPVAALYEAKGLGPAAGFGWYTADKDEPICDTMERLGDAAVRRAAGRGVGLRLQHRHPRLHRRAGVGHAARRIHPHAHHRPARHEGHAVLPAAGAARSARGGLRAAAARRARSSARPTAPAGRGNYVDGPRKSFAGGAGLLSTARDYARFLEMIRNGGALDGVRILSPRTVELMTHQPGRHAAFGDRARLRARLRDDRPLRRQRAGFGRRVRLGRRVRHDLPRRPEARLVLVLMIQLLPNATDIGDAVPDAGLPGVAVTDGFGVPRGPEPCLLRNSRKRFPTPGPGPVTTGNLAGPSNVFENSESGSFGWPIPKPNP